MSHLIINNIIVKTVEINQSDKITKQNLHKKQGKNWRGQSEKENAMFDIDSTVVITNMKTDNDECKNVMI